MASASLLSIMTIQQSEYTARWQLLINSGDAFWATPQNTSLIYVNSENRIVLKVDNTTSVPYLEKRYSPKLYSRSRYNIGTVWVMDAVHLPYGCSVWPAYWTQGPDWPEHGEIDIIEGVNAQKVNMVALHTANGSRCAISETGNSFSGRVEHPSCDQSLNFGSGCTVFDRNENSYGEAFKNAGGGVYVAEWAKNGIRVWFFTRSSIPASLHLKAEEIDTSVFGTPLAAYSSETCDIENLFGPQMLTINIALCGDYAGQKSILEQTCRPLKGEQTCYTTYVINDAAQTYANAYFEINYINVYASSNPIPDSSSSGSSGVSTVHGIDATTTLRAVPSGTTAANGKGQQNGAQKRFTLRWTEAFGLLVGILIANCLI
ncbi:hypothetical protein L204_106029 [Cryptococcus depauperatus]|nr:hypothetical protein L204_05158 [Cryptococcus depauperatus CBS 7855]